jgi:hypothetical protein
MASILFKWFFTTGLCMLFTNTAVHPIYVSVIEIEHNAGAKTLEVSCKLFTDDFEKALRATYKTPVDLINPTNRAAMDKLINEYVQKHVKITSDNKAVVLRYLGYEQVEEGIYSYYEASNVSRVKEIAVVNNLLYEYKPEQMGLIHITVNGNRKSTKLNNPDDRDVINF